MRDLPGANQRDSASYAVANLSSLFTVCALALDSVEEWNDDIRKSVTKDIKLVLEWGALAAGDACEMVEKLEGDK